MNEVMSTEEMIQMMQSATMNISNLGQQMGVIQREVSNVNNRMSEIENRMTYYEDTVRLTRDQQRRVKAAIHGRVDYLLGIKTDGGVVIKECLSDDKKYRGGFLRRCYHDAREKSHLGTPYQETCQRDYETVIDYVSHWTPEVTFEGLSGVEAYKKYLDIRAEEKGQK